MYTAATCVEHSGRVPVHGEGATCRNARAALRCRPRRYGRPVDAPLARRLFQLVEPVAVVTYLANEPTEAVMALGLRNVWDAYFAGRAAPLGRDTPAAVVHALFYNFAEGEVARHIP